tara:strand:- start:3653 stop:4009 length:357 start_codon:yes stop_codon:yes gene_type:complete
LKRVKADTLDRKDFYPKYLKLVNVILPKPLTSKEIEILSAFMELQGDVIEDDRFGTQSRKLIRKKFGFKTYSNIDNYIKYFKDKGVLVKEDGKLQINRRIFIPKDEQEVELIFKFKLI